MLALVELDERGEHERGRGSDSQDLVAERRQCPEDALVQQHELLASVVEREGVEVFERGFSELPVLRVDEGVQPLDGDVFDLDHLAGAAVDEQQLPEELVHLDQDGFVGLVQQLVHQRGDHADLDQHDSPLDHPCHREHRSVGVSADLHHFVVDALLDLFWDSSLDDDVSRLDDFAELRLGDSRLPRLAKTAL